MGGPLRSPMVNPPKRSSAKESQSPPLVYSPSLTISSPVVCWRSTRCRTAASPVKPAGAGKLPTCVVRILWVLRCIAQSYLPCRKRDSRHKIYSTNAYSQNTRMLAVAVSASRYLPGDGLRRRRHHGSLGFSHRRPAHTTAALVRIRHAADEEWKVSSLRDDLPFAWTFLARRTPGRPSLRGRRGR